jgi:2Fe-2S ferredoxin
MAVNRVVVLQDERGRVVRREWAAPLVADELGINPDAEVDAQRLAAEQGLAPPVLEYDRTRRFMIMPFVDGEPLEADWSTRPERRRAMRELLSRLRSIDSSSLPTLDVAARLRALYERLERYAPERARRYWQELDGCTERMALIEGSVTSLVHGDLTPENVLVRADGSLCLIDWEYAHRGHGDEDLAGLALATAGLDDWSVVPAEFDVRVRARGLLDDLWRELAAALASDARPGQTTPMPTLKVIDRDGHEHDVPARAGVKIMETLRELDYGIAAICGGMCSCATCHVYVDPAWSGKIPAPMSDERELLQELAHHKDGSRLSCQIDMTDELDGLRVTIAPDE